MMSFSNKNELLEKLRAIKTAYSEDKTLNWQTPENTGDFKLTAENINIEGTEINSISLVYNNIMKPKQSFTLDPKKWEEFENTRIVLINNTPANILERGIIFKDASDNVVFSVIIHDLSGNYKVKKDVLIKYLFDNNWNPHKNSTFPNKGVIVFVNGEVEQFGDIVGENKTYKRGTIYYWTERYVNLVLQSFGGEPNEIIFRDGDQGFSIYERFDAGYKRGKNDFEYIVSRLGRNSDGLITGTVKIVSHSKGGAYALGYIKGYSEMRYNPKNSSRFLSMEDGLIKEPIELNLMIAPHQGNNGSVMTVSSRYCKSNIALRHTTDPISSEIEGNVLFIETSFGFAFAAHSIDGFHPETEAVIKQFIINKKAKKEDLMEGIEAKVRAISK